ncbi:MAG TPA: metalloregulator ArsR/SmtB family transcription factor [Puia sp.]|nr:metalloregulator ArsR/SmtB family transcription factor [Puia sp.]
MRKKLTIIPIMRRDVFQAIADPTRRNIINLLARQPLNLNGVAENFNTSRPAISKHIKILTECGLVVIRQEGRERHCEIKMGKLDEVSGWVEQCRLFWSEKLDNLERFLASAKASAPAKAPVPVKAPAGSKVTAVASKASVPTKTSAPAKVAASSKSSATKKTPSVRRTAPPKS